MGDTMIATIAPPGETRMFHNTTEPATDTSGMTTKGAHHDQS